MSEPLQLPAYLHSGGAFNKEPDNDLGNYPSQFHISGEPLEPPPGNPINVMNNLFRDVMPEEALAGMIDYRCFYIWNVNVTWALTGINLSFTECDCGSSTLYGSLYVNDVQQINITCEGFESTPDVGGYVVFDCEFGPPFTVYYNGSFASFGANLQAAINELPWCNSVSVSGSNPFIVTFQGGVGNRNVQLMRVVQNDLLSKGISRLDTVTYYQTDGWNGYGKSLVMTVEPISDYIPQSGILRIYNPLTGLWDAYPYSSHSGNIFQLIPSLQFNMVGFLGTNPPYGNTNDPDNWQRSAPSPETGNPLPVPWGVVEAPYQDKNCQVCISKITQGSPINTIAAPIPDPYTPPDATFSSGGVSLGNLRPNEGFFIWIQRTTPPGASPCLRNSFTVSLNAMAVSWPLQT